MQIIVKKYKNQNFKKKILVSNNISALVKVRDRMIKAKNKLNAVLQK